jgi:hypothetical protein
MFWLSTEIATFALTGAFLAFSAAGVAMLIPLRLRLA